MKGVAAIIISLCDLLEAEGRVFRVSVFRLVRAVLTLLIALGFAAAGLAFLTAAAYQWLALYLPAPLVSGLTGLLCAGVFFLLYWSAQKWNQPKKKAKTPKKD